MSVLVRSMQKPGRVQRVYTQTSDDKYTVPLDQWVHDAYGDSGYRHWILPVDMAQAICIVMDKTGVEPLEYRDEYTWFTYMQNNIQFEVWIWANVPDTVDTYPLPKHWHGIELDK